MNINTDLSLKNIKMPKQIEKPKVPVGYTNDNKTGIVLPDIRSNQILLPDNKIFTTTSIKIEKEFNKQNITIEVPNHYKKVEAENEKPMTVTARNTFKRAKVAQFENTKTGANIIRVTKNVFTDSGILNSAEVMEINTKNPRKATRYIKDYEHNSETEIKVTMPFKPRLTTNDEVTTIYRNNKGNIIKTEEYTKSAVKGVYDITETDAAGNKTIISKATKDNDGNILIEKNLVSLDGTKTEYRYESSQDGCHKKLFTQITDKDGNVLSTIDRTYDKDGDITYSSVNGHKYKAEKKNEGIEITDYFKNEKVFIREKDKLATDEEKFAIHNINKKTGHARPISNENVVEKLFDTLPADAILTLNNNVKTVIPLDDDLDSVFMAVFDILQCKTDNFTVNHELGHSIDAEHTNEEITQELLLKGINKHPISNNEQFKKAYVEEKAMFIKEFPDFGEKFISYFLNGTEAKPNAGRSETTAESNAINGLDPASPERLAMRTTLLQRYFPRSIAELTKLMNPIALAETTQQAVQE